jgi:hypothetical protein
MISENQMKSILAVDFFHQIIDSIHRPNVDVSSIVKKISEKDDGIYLVSVKIRKEFFSEKSKLTLKEYF